MGTEQLFFEDLGRANLLIQNIVAALHSSGGLCCCAVPAKRTPKGPRLSAGSPEQSETT